MDKLLNAADSKNDCLAGWCNERINALNSIHNQWERLKSLVENHSALIEVQLNSVKSQIEINLADLSDEIERFRIRWGAVVNELETNEASSMEPFESCQQRWKSLQQQKENLSLRCEKYSLEIPVELNEQFEKLSTELSAKSDEWKIFNAFNVEYENLLAEEWAIFCRRPYILSNFVAKWSSSSGDGRNLAEKRISAILENIREASSVLHDLQNDSISDKHWTNIFRILRMQFKSFYDITLKDLLANSSLLIENGTELKKIAKQASSEQIVRQAIVELDQWGSQAELKTFVHNDSRGQSILLVKDFQDVLNKVISDSLVENSVDNNFQLIFRSATISVFCSQRKIQRRSSRIRIKPRFGSSGSTA